MRICCILNIAPVYRKAIFELLREELGADLYFGDSSIEGIAMLPTAPYQRVKNVYRGSKLVWQRKAIRRAFSKRYDAYILTGNAGIRSNWMIAVLARLLGRKVYLWSHGLRGDETPATLRKNLMYMRLVNGVLLYGERAQKLLFEHGIKNTTVIYNSLDYEGHQAILKRIGDSADESFFRNYFGNDLPTICYLGRVIPSKQLDMLLDVMPDLECNLVIVGGGRAADDLQKQAEELVIADRVWFYGESYDDTFIGTLLSNCRVTVNPSSIGLTAIHSLTFGTPVLTHDELESQMPESEVIIEGTTGFYYKKGDKQSLMETIKKAINTPKNRDTCKEVIAQKYNPQAQIKILKKFFGIDIEIYREENK